MVRLSNTSMNIYKECGYKFDLHYNQRIRSTTTNSALIFGTALDAAISHLLTKKEGELEVFEKHWSESSINGVLINVSTSPLIKYSKSDFDGEIVKVTNELEEIITKRDINGFESLTIDEKVLLNKAHWDCLLVKGKLLIEAFKRDIYPNIEKVLGLQVPIKVENEAGDTIIGFADIVCKYKGYDKPIIFDLKTSARKYPPNSVIESVQLGLYTYALSNTYGETNLAGYMVLVKDIKKDRSKICPDCGTDRSNTRFKNCDAAISPKRSGAGGAIAARRCGGEFNEKVTLYATTQVLIDTISDDVQDSIMQDAENIKDSIKDSNFDKNENSCIGKYGKCVYYDLCKKNSMDGLIKLDKNEVK